jgi:glycerol uptake facilitator-like aquaporin
MAPFAISLTLGFLCLMGGTVSGGVFNPARAFGPAVISKTWRNQELYWAAGFIGGGLAALTQKFFKSVKF